MWLGNSKASQLLLHQDIFFETEALILRSKVLRKVICGVAQLFGSVLSVCLKPSYQHSWPSSHPKWQHDCRSSWRARTYLLMGVVHVFVTLMLRIWQMHELYWRTLLQTWLSCKTSCFSARLTGCCKTMWNVRGWVMLHTDALRHRDRPAFSQSCFVLFFHLTTLVCGFAFDRQSGWIPVCVLLGQIS